ncbi:sensor domain-containing diguanylate cyclase [Rheinheimera riviphila]|uniref:diguanylate cyclase n=1 Tax=Rheinheimera riviphila TaxID=1834037 RepID=A0A437R513_9GAMM|nr:GGDEF domain-containing protein [Rheinheimera riviphila]RVU41854.1 sensor domain-containing diguanylate cyclase [Rheinheimera riviphila]
MQLLQRSALCRDLALLLLWLLVWQCGRLVEYTEHASVWFPSAGLTFAAMLVLGLRAIPALLIACVLITFFSVQLYQLPLNFNQTLQAGLLFGLAHILPYGVGAWLLRVLASRGQRHFPKLVLQFLLIAAGSALAASVLVIVQLVLCRMLPFSQVESTWLPFWIGDLAGVVVIAPLLFAVLTRFKPSALFRLTDVAGLQQLRWSRRVSVKILLNIALLTAVMFLVKLTHSANSAFAIFFLLIPHMWLACTESAFVNVISVAISSTLIVLWVHLFGLMEFVMVYQFAVTVIAANTLFGLSLPALIEDNIRLRQVAFTDSLTQTATREWLEQQAGLEILRHQHTGLPLSLVLFDVDHFKQINDAYGHQVGDQALATVCQITRHYLRPSDLLARYGGDEFVLLLPDTSAEAAALIAGRILAQLRLVRIADLTQISASFGVSQYQPGQDYSSLFAQADKALYQAKQQGRDQVQLYAEAVVPSAT